MPRWARVQDMQAVRTLWQERFGDSDAFADFFFRERARPETTVVFDEEGCISSALQVLPAAVCVRGRTVHAAMLCGVSTARQFEGRGHMGACLRFAMQALRQTGCALVVQRPVDFRIYRRFSFVPVSDAQFFTLAPDLYAGLPASVSAAVHPDLLPQMQALYAHFCRPYSTWLIRTAADFSCKLSDYLCDGGEGWLLYDSHGLAEAYAFCESGNDGCLQLREAAWLSEDAVQRMFAALCQKASRRGLQFSGRLPVNIDVPFSTRKTAFGAAAVANTAQLLQTVFNDPDFCIRIREGAAEGGTFDLSGRRTNRRPDAVLDAGQLAQLACGYRSLRELSCEGAQIFDMDRAEAFDRQWPKQPCFTWDEY